MKYRFLFIVPFFALAQVGIGTKTPKATLHVHGDVRVTKEINLGGTADTKGDSPKTGQVIVSKGPGKTPAWEYVPSAEKIKQAKLVAHLSNVDASSLPARGVLEDYIPYEFIEEDKELSTLKYNEVNVDSDYLTVSNQNKYFTIQKTGFYKITGNIIGKDYPGSLPYLKEKFSYSDLRLFSHRNYLTYKVTDVNNSDKLILEGTTSQNSNGYSIRYFESNSLGFSGITYLTKGTVLRFSVWSMAIEAEVEKSEVFITYLVDSIM